MSLFENYVRETQQIELEIERKGVALGLDWDNELQIREIARKALAGPQKEVSVAFHNLSWNDRAMLELFALSQLMLTVMQESANDQIHIHGGPLWKTLARALWAEHDLRCAK